MGCKRRFFVFGLLIINLLFSIGCGDNQSTSSNAQTSSSAAKSDSKTTTKIQSLADLNNANVIIGGEIGTLSIGLAAERFPNAQINHYPVCVDAFPALATKKITAVVYDKPALDYAMLAQPDFFVIPEPLAGGHISVGGPFRNRELMDKVNDFIRQYRADGTYDEMYNRWISTPNPVMPDIPKPENPDGFLVFGSDCMNVPMSYIGADGSVTGFDQEFIKRLAIYLNVDYEVKIFTYDALFPACESGKIDLAVGNLDATEERKQSMLFSEEYINSPISIMVRREDWYDAADGTTLSEDGADSWWSRSKKSLAASFERTFLRENRWKLILDGLKITVFITILAAIFGTIFAFPVCFLRRSHNRVLQWLGKSYVALMQGTPMLVILMILYYVIFAKIDIDAVIVAVIGFGLNFAAYAGEMLRTGIDGVPKGQKEAALALGFSPMQTFWKVTFPQTLQRILPVYRGEFINMLKMTSIVGYIAIQDLTKMSDIIRSRTYEAFFPLIATAVIYFVVAQLLALSLGYIEYRLDPRSRRRAAHKGGALK